MEELIRLKEKNERLKDELLAYRKLLNNIQNTAESAVRINEMLAELHHQPPKYKCKLLVLK